MVLADGRPSACFLFLVRGFLRPPVCRRLCQLSLDIPEQGIVNSKIKAYWWKLIVKYSITQSAIFFWLLIWQILQDKFGYNTSYFPHLPMMELDWKDWSKICVLQNALRNLIYYRTLKVLKISAKILNLTVLCFILNDFRVNFTRILNTASRTNLSRNDWLTKFDSTNDFSHTRFSQCLTLDSFSMATYGTNDFRVLATDAIIPNLGYFEHRLWPWF